MIMQWQVYNLSSAPELFVLVVSGRIVNETMPHITVIPVVRRRSDREVYPTEATFALPQETGGTEFIVMAHQIRTIRRSDLGLCVREISDDQTIRAVLDALEAQLDLHITRESSGEECHAG
jgi:mRNA interferase MazF